MPLFIGLMSGTSMDGIDAALCRFDEHGAWQGVLGHVHHPMAPALRAALMDLQRSGTDELHRTALAANALSRGYAAAVADLLATTGTPAAAVRAIGAHGQTVRHQPNPPEGDGYTWQIQNPALLAECCGIDVVADFRSRDIAAGGQGAPLVPPFHAAVLGTPDEVRAVVNIGGIANLTLLRPDEPPRGWDTGPGNLLMDLWVARHHGCDYDEDGRWAASGTVHDGLLNVLLAEDFFRQPPPKSTGRDLFGAAWLAQRLADVHATAAPLPPADVQATLLACTARSIALDLQAHAPDATRLLVCGGGALNAALMARLQAECPAQVVASTEAAGLPPMQVEAAAFAWLAASHVLRRPASAPAVTGARGARVLGALYPA